jgi:hypothetical protein
MRSSGNENLPGIGCAGARASVRQKIDGGRALLAFEMMPACWRGVSLVYMVGKHHLSEQEKPG